MTNKENKKESQNERNSWIRGRNPCEVKLTEENSAA